MNATRLRDVLSVVTATATVKERIPDALTQFARSHEPATDPEKQEVLIEFLQSEEELRTFKEGYQQLPGSSRSASYRRLSEWMVRRSLEVGPGQVIADIERYLASDHIPISAVAAVIGILPEQGFRLSDAITMVPWPDAPPSLEKELLSSRPRRSIGIVDPLPTCALVRNSSVPKVHLPDAALVDPQGPDYSTLLNACRLLTLIGPSSPICIGFWYTPAPWVPQSSDLSVLTPLTELGHPDRPILPLGSGRFAEVRRLFERYERLQQSERDRLRVPIDRLNQAQRRLDITDRMIDLGIAIEAIFLTDDEGTMDLSYRIRVRAARFLRAEPNERNQVFGQFGKLYALRSRAVHDGYIRPTRENIEMIQTGTAVVAESIRKLIDEGLVEWRKIEMS